MYERLPTQVPIHFDLHGVADGFAPRLVGALLMPALSLAVWGVVRGAPLVLRGEARARALASPLAETALIVVALFAGLHVVMLDVALSGAPRAGRGLGFVLAGFSIALGLLMPKLRRNGFAGIRTPRSLSSDEVWQRTHRVGGALFVLAGVAGLAATALGHFAVAIGALVAASLAAAIASYVVRDDARR
ncbi:MAG: SdpI family protein [Myxococcales bacterium]|nr:SdpI family protein [Myxococcales bacterium]